jgi:hypothetical protein
MLLLLVQVHALQAQQPCVQSGDGLSLCFSGTQVSASSAGGRPLSSGGGGGGTAAHGGFSSRGPPWSHSQTPLSILCVENH